jgi:SP family galactose:H+ symporter-like MFS transporter
MKLYQEKISLFTCVAVLAATLGSFLFGYQTAIISGALSILANKYSLSATGQGWLVSITLLGAMVGVVFAGVIADRFGRRMALLLPAFLFILGSFIVIGMDNLTVFFTGRFITGLAVGLVSMTSPLYLAEIAPTSQRGRFVCLHQVVVTIGVLLAYLVNLRYGQHGDWKTMFGLALIPSILMFICMLFVCESPSWLLSKGLIDSAVRAFTKLRTDKSWQQHMVAASTFTAHDNTQSLLKMFFKSKVRYILILGIVLNMFQQITGINTIIYYAPSIFELAGFTSDSFAKMAAVALGSANVMATLISVWLIEKMGRRKLLIASAIGMGLSMQIVALFFFFASPDVAFASFYSILAFVAFFAIGLGPVTVVLVSELYPLSIRGRAMSVVTAANWFFNYLISLVFLDLVSLLEIKGVFQMYAIIACLALIFICTYLPETKGKSLEEIESSMK